MNAPTTPAELEAAVRTSLGEAAGELFRLESLVSDDEARKHMGLARAAICKALGAVHLFAAASVRNPALPSATETTSSDP